MVLRTCALQGLFWKWEKPNSFLLSMEIHHCTQLCFFVALKMATSVAQPNHSFTHVIKRSYPKTCSDKYGCVTINSAWTFPFCCPSFKVVREISVHFRSTPGCYFWTLEHLNLLKNIHSSRYFGGID